MQASAVELEPQRRRYIKCVIWDLDNTIWDGVLLEDTAVRLRAHVAEIIRVLDGRGILQSVASRNDYEAAMAQLRRFGLDEYFIYPQINWNSKAASVKTIIESINIGPDAVAFVDDQPFELEEVKFSLPELLCLDAGDLSRLLAMPEMNPRFDTPDSRNRRRMYLSDIERQQKEKEFVGPREEFLTTLGMVFKISAAREEDLPRAEELTVRTNQLNTTGVTYSYEELEHFMRSADHRLLVASLEDKYGSYGTIGLALLECREDVWVIKLLLMSCRVMSRGVGAVTLNYIMRQARRANVRLLSEFIATGRNRMMYVSYKFAGFREVEKRGALSILENDLTNIQPLPDYIDCRIEPDALP